MFATLAILVILGMSPMIKFASAQRPLQILLMGSGSDIQTIRTFLEGLERGYNFTTVDSYEVLDAVWPERDKYDLMIFEYHAFEHNPWLIDWLNESAAELRNWVSNGGGIIATIKDDVDEPLAALFGLTKIEIPENVPEGASGSQIISIDPLSPFGVNITDSQIEVDCDYGFAEPLPEWVKWTATVSNETASCVVFVAGKYGKGALFFGGPEFTGIEDPHWAPGDPRFENFWKNILLWMEEVLGAEEEGPPTPPPEAEYYTKEEVDALIQQAIDQAVQQAVQQAVSQATQAAQSAAEQAALEAVQGAMPDTTTPTILGVVGIILAIIALGVSFARRK